MITDRKALRKTLEGLAETDLTTAIYSDWPKQIQLKQYIPTGWPQVS